MLPVVLSADRLHEEPAEGSVKNPFDRNMCPFQHISTVPICIYLSQILSFISHNSGFVWYYFHTKRISTESEGISTLLFCAAASTGVRRNRNYHEHTAVSRI